MQNKQMTRKKIVVRTLPVIELTIIMLTIALFLKGQILYL